MSMIATARPKASPCNLSFFVALICAAVTLIALPRHARAQSQELMPAASAAKAHDILNQAVAALGGETYLRMRDLDCKGHYGQFDSASGETGGAIEARFAQLTPDKTRTELEAKTFLTDIYYFPIQTKGHVVMIYTPDGAWAYTKEHGVADMGADTVSDYKDQLQTSLSTILRSRLDEPGLMFRYAGSDIVDLKQIDWVEITDKQQRVVRVAVDQKTHLPVRYELVARDPATNKRTDNMRTYTNYHDVGGIQVPFQTALFLNDRPISQTFYSSCQANTGLSPALFTREGLESETAKTNKKGR